MLDASFDSLPGPASVLIIKGPEINLFISGFVDWFGGYSPLKTWRKNVTKKLMP
jgi:hypothetical protein